MINHNITEKIKVQRVDRITIPRGQIVTLERQGNIYAEVLAMENKPKIAIRKISSEKYMVLATGEIKDFAPNGGDKHIRNLRQTFAKLRGMIRTNFTAEGHNQLFITLTYRENVRDEKRVYRDFEVFYKRLKRHISVKGHQLEYIVVVEPQQRGAWHIHLMLKSDQPVLHIDMWEITRMWGHGRTKTERLKAEDVGAYYVSYFTDLLDKQKNRKKGARLKYYPVGMRIWRASRGVIRPEKEKRTYGDIVAEYGEAVYSNTYGVDRMSVDDSTGEVIHLGTLNVIQRETFRKINE